MTNIKFLKKYDISKIKSIVLSLPEHMWEEDISRQNTFFVHKNTKTIFNTDFPNDWEGGNYPLKKYLLPQDLQTEIDYYIKDLEKEYNGKVGKSMLVSLNPESFIYPHIDSGLYLTKCFRCHIPILTNELVHFFAGNDWVMLDEGDSFELNNQAVHSVVNYSQTPRIHLIIDIIPKALCGPLSDQEK